MVSPASHLGRDNQQTGLSQPARQPQPLRVNVQQAGLCIVGLVKWQLRAPREYFRRQNTELEVL